MLRPRLAPKDLEETRGQAAAVVARRHWEDSKHFVGLQSPYVESIRVRSIDCISAILLGTQLGEPIPHGSSRTMKMHGSHTSHESMVISLSPETFSRLTLMSNANDLEIQQKLLVSSQTGAHHHAVRCPSSICECSDRMQARPVCQ